MDYLVKFTDSKIQNIILNICIFLFGINLIYKANYVLLITFVLLVIFKRFRINIGNLKVLIILILFSISWFIFNDNEISGICLPIGYLIGCNVIKEDTNRLNFFYLLFFSLALYTTSFLINNIINSGIASYDVYNQMNIWTGRPLWATNIMLYSSLFMSLFGYILFVEKRKIIKLTYFIIFAINGIYAFLLSRRAAFLMVIISVLSIFIYKFVTDNKDERKKLLKTLLRIIIAFILFIILFVLFYCLNNDFNSMIKSTDLYIRFISYEDITMIFNDMGRTKIRKTFIENMWSHPYGGSEIREIIGNFGHDIWLDAYDAGGVVSFIIIIVYTIIFIAETIIIFIDKQKRDYKALLLCMLICILAQMSIEPIMEACKPYIYSVCIYHGVISNHKRSRQ